MTAHEKAAGMLDTSEAALKTTHPEFTPEKKRLATLRARAAMAGVQLHVYDDEDTGQTVYLVSRWALTRDLASLDAVETWLTQVTGVRS
ncbi:MAG: hypothetical protein U1D29_14345 [Burkholderiales bacterium]|nr:hypothetical protein [Burkholderiales bacterium]